MKKGFYILSLAILLLGGASLLSQSEIFNEALAQSNSSFDVSLISQDPVFSRSDIPTGYDGGIGHFPFEKIDWIPSGHFIVNGPAASGINGSKFESGGMWLLDKEGKFLDQRDVIKDTSPNSAACFEGGGCNVGLTTVPISDNLFLRELDPPRQFFRERSPILYEVRNNEIRIEDRLFFNDFELPSFGGELRRGDISEFTDLAVANGVMVGVEEHYEGNNRISRRVAFYEVPGFDSGRGRLGEISIPPEPCRGSACSGVQPLSIQPYTPVIGFGGYFLAHLDQEEFGTYGVFKMPDPNNFEVSDLREPLEIISTPDTDPTYARGQILASERDVINKNRVMIYWSGGDTEILEDQNGVFVRSAHVPDHFGPKTVGPVFTFAGDIVAHVDHPGDTVPVSQSGTWITVERAGQPLSVEPLPLPEEDDEEQEGFFGVHALGISPEGVLLVSASHDNGSIYAYRIGEGVPQGPGPDFPGIPDFPNFPDFGAFPEVDFDFFLNIANDYMSQIQEIFGTGNQASSQCGRPLTSEARIREFQCENSIVCEGTPETTGYGNLGPITEAKWRELCGTDPLIGAGGNPNRGPFNQDVRGASIDLTGNNVFNSINKSLGNLYDLGQGLLR